MNEQKSNYQIFEEYLLNTILFQSIRIDGNEDIINSILDEMDLYGIDMVDQILGHENVFWIYLELSEADFYKLQLERMKVKDVKADFFYYGITNEKTDTFYLFQIIKIKIPKQRKSVEELEIELNQAIKIEDYRAAAALKKDIELKRIKYLNKVAKKKDNKKK